MCHTEYITTSLSRTRAMSSNWTSARLSCPTVGSIPSIRAQRGIYSARVYDNYSSTVHQVISAGNALFASSKPRIATE